VLSVVTTHPYEAEHFKTPVREHEQLAHVTVEVVRCKQRHVSIEVD
jgi:hypothetical protein